MPITRGAKKAHRQSLRKAAFNSRRKSRADKSIKAFKKLLASGDKKGLVEALRQAQKALDKAAQGKTLSRNTVARKKSRLSKLLKKA